MTTEYFDVIIVGAGLSGIGAAAHLVRNCPSKSFTVLEARDVLGGTWDLFRYPGIRSDSDMYTFGYSFKPWLNRKAIADGPSILNYIQETAAEYGIDQNIRYGYQVRSASWSSDEAAWTIASELKDDGEVVELKCNMLLMCSGYYRYDKGYTPDFTGRDRFEGPIVHPQHWPEDLDYQDKRVIVIGSGATAVTLVPSLAETAAHVTMLQRSPTYIVSQPDKDPIANFLNFLLPEELAYRVIRRKNVAFQQFYYQRMRKNPVESKKVLVDMVRRELGKDFDVEKHFAPSYYPWDQRLCVAPNGDLFKAIKSGDATVVTDHIESFVEDGIQLKSGEHLPADIIVTATGIEILVLGGIVFTVDGRPIESSETFTYKGMMVNDVPNLIITFGYINASWTLRSDLTAEYVCRLINLMDEKGVKRVTPVLPLDAPDMQPRDFLEGFTPGYLSRAKDLMPSQGDREPWINPQNYKGDKQLILHGDIEDDTLEFD